MNKEILGSLVLIGLVAIAVGGGATGAFFSDMETSSGNTLAAGALDLKVNGRDDPQVGAIVNITDLKPSMWQYVPVNLTISNNPGKLWKHINLSKEIMSTGVVTEPECTEQGGIWNGAACDWRGNKDNNDILPVTDFDLSVTAGNQTTVIIAPNDNISVYEARSCWIPLGTFGVFPNTTTIQVNQSFHMRNSVTNWAQGDVAIFQEEFLVTQINAPDPTYPNTNFPRVWNPALKKCVDVQPGTAG